MPDASFVGEARGAVLMTSPLYGRVAVAFTPEEALGAQLAYPDAAVFSPREIGELEGLRGDPRGLELVLAAKRILGGVLVTVRPAPATLEQAA